MLSICLVFGFLLAVPGTVNAKGTKLNYSRIKGLLNKVSLRYIPIWHLQLEITVANKENSGTDDDVYFRLKNGDRYYLNSARDDFERGKKYTFSLLYPGVSKVGDIKYLTIGKKGDDGLCIKKVNLYINKATNSPIFSKTYASGKWIDNDKDNKPFISFPLNNRSWRLRLSNLKSMNMIILPTIISQSNLEDIIESRIGDLLAEKQLRDNHIKWYKQGDEAVTVKRVDHNTIKVDLDLGWKWKKVALEVDVDFKIDINIRNRDIKIIARGFSITPVSSLLKKVPYIKDKIKYLERRLSSEVDVIYEDNNLKYIPKIEVKGDGDIEINWRIPLT
jgi:hypothetical protein